MRSMIKLALAISALLTWGSARAAAQVPCASGEPRVTDEARLTEARARFVAGTQAAEAGTWLEALAGFEDAYELSHLPAALFNSARALEELGRLRAAREAYDCVLGSPAGISEEDQSAIRARRDALNDRIPRLIVEGLPLRDSLELEVDGFELDDGRRPLVVLLDPGEHTLRATRHPAGIFRWRGSLSEAQRLTVRARWGDTAATEGDEPREDSSLLEEPWLWVACGAVLAGAAVAFIAVESGGGLDPRTDIAHDL